MECLNGNRKEVSWIILALLFYIMTFVGWDAQIAIQFCLHEKNVRSPAFSCRFLNVTLDEFVALFCESTLIVLLMLRFNAKFRHVLSLISALFAVFCVNKPFFQCHRTSRPSAESSEKAQLPWSFSSSFTFQHSWGLCPEIFWDQRFQEKRDSSSAWIRRFHTGDYEGRIFVITRTDELQSFVSIEKEMTNASCFALKTCHKSSACLLETLGKGVSNMHTKKES